MWKAAHFGPHKIANVELDHIGDNDDDQQMMSRSVDVIIIIMRPNGQLRSTTIKFGVDG